MKRTTKPKTHTPARKPLFAHAGPCPGIGGQPGTLTVTVSRGGVLRMTWRPDQPKRAAKTTTPARKPE